MLQTSVSHRAATAAAIGAAGLLSACASTHRQVLEGQIATYDAAIAQTRIVTDQLEQEHGPGPFQLRVFIADRAVNGALAVLDGMSFDIPDGRGARATIRSVRLDRQGAAPIVALDVEAQRGQLAVAVRGAAILTPTATPGELKLAILSFVPEVRWWRIEFTKARLVRDLLAVQAQQVTARMPTIHLPVDASLPIGAPAATNPVRFKTSATPSFLTMEVTVPSTRARLVTRNTRYYFVRNGIYLFSDLDYGAAE